jgi:hypothetical protein
MASQFSFEKRKKKNGYSETGDLNNYKDMAVCLSGYPFVCVIDDYQIQFLQHTAWIMLTNCVCQVVMMP